MSSIFVLIGSQTDPDVELKIELFSTGPRCQVREPPLIAEMTTSATRNIQTFQAKTRSWSIRSTINRLPRQMFAKQYLLRSICPSLPRWRRWNHVHRPTLSGAVLGLLTREGNISRNPRASRGIQSSPSVRIRASRWTCDLVTEAHVEQQMRLAAFFAMRVPPSRTQTSSEIICRRMAQTCEPIEYCLDPRSERLSVTCLFITSDVPSSEV